MFRNLLLALAAACWGSVASAASRPDPQHSQALDQLIAHYANVYGVPERLVHRVVQRESGYNPHAMHNAFYGLMQITYQTARGMGYRGAPAGLLDPEVNLTYAVSYLANAYKAADGNESDAVRLYASGYYYVAKRKHLLGQLRTAAAPSLER
jgi:soluble lytic murein transglycosylase-like protein